MRSALGQLLDCAVDQLLALGGLDLLGGLGPLAGEQVAEGGLAVLADRLIEAGQRRGSARAARATSSTGSFASAAISSSVGSRPSLVLSSLSTLRTLVWRCATWTGSADRPAVVLQPALERLADPKCPVCRELEATAPVELLDRPDQAEHALLDEVLHREAMALIAAGLGDDQPKVGVDHPFLGGQVTTLDALGQVDLLLGGEQRVRTGGTQEQVKRVLSQGTRYPRLLRCEGGGTALVAARGLRRRTCRRGVIWYCHTVLAAGAGARGCFRVCSRPDAGASRAWVSKLFRSISVDLMGLLRRIIIAEVR